MLSILAETEHERALVQGYWSIVLIGLIGLAAVLLLVVIFVGRRWTRRQLLAIEKDKAQRREAKSSQRPDAWQTSAQRYIDHDKLPDETPGDTPPDEQDDPDDPPFNDEDDDEAARNRGPGDEQMQEDKDPYGLFDGAPYREPDDDEDDDPDEDWDDEDEDEDDKR